MGMDSFNRSSLVYGDTGSCGPMGVISTCIDINCFNNIEGSIKVADDALRLHRSNLNFVFKKN